MYVIIVGCGSLGGHLANELSGEGHDVVVIDKNPDSFQDLNGEFSGFTVVADATEAQVLKTAHIDEADVVVASTQDDNVNLMIAQVAKKLNRVPIVIARVFDPARQSIYEDLGIETICPTTLSALEFKQAVLSLKES